MKCWPKPARKMAEGEVLQLYYNGNPAMPEADYLRIVEHKTAGLIAASCRMGAIIADATEEQQEALFRFGQYLGWPFKSPTIRWTIPPTASIWAKHSGRTSGKGKPRCRCLHLLTHCSEQDSNMIKDRMETRTLTDEDLRRLIHLMEEAGSIAYAMDRAQGFIAAAQRELNLFEDSTAKRALTVAADYMVTRDR